MSDNQRQSQPQLHDWQTAHSEYCESASEPCPLRKLHWRNLWEYSTDYRTYRLNLVTPLRRVLRECGLVGRRAARRMATGTRRSTAENTARLTQKQTCGRFAVDRLESVTPQFVKYMPDTLEHGKLYISEEFGTAIHLCACGCGKETVMPFKPEWSDGWDYANDNGVVTFAPSIGNMKFCPNQAHYYIEQNRVRWC